MNVGELDYAFPESAAALRPPERREDARLLLVPAGTGEPAPFGHASIRDLPQLFEAGEVLVLNDSRVRPARLVGAKETGGRVEILVLEQRPDAWTALVRASRSPVPGSVLVLPEGARVRVAGREGDLFLLVPDGDLEGLLERHGTPPLPPYIDRDADAADVLRYQTVFARASGGRWGSEGSSVAAPTAGLHLTPQLLTAIADRGVTIVRVALGVGAGTFRPIETARVEDHRMHEERFEVSGQAAHAVTQALRSGARVTAVGTTSLRTLEAAASAGGRVRALRGSTGLFAVPGTRFRTASRLLTNFHRPHSTLLALAAAFAGTRCAIAAHEEAVRNGYRLFSYGDAMLVERHA